MTIMVDELQVWSPTKLRMFRNGSSHLTTDGPLEELHALAARIGLRRAWFQDHPLHPHYDLTPSRRERALAEGAVFVPAKEQARARVERRGRAVAALPAVIRALDGLGGGKAVGPDGAEWGFDTSKGGGR